MKQFVVRAYDGEGMLDKRMEVRPRHLEGMEKIKEHVWFFKVQRIHFYDSIRIQLNNS